MIWFLLSQHGWTDPPRKCETGNGCFITLLLFANDLKLGFSCRGASRRAKKAGVGNDPQVVTHTGLLVDGPPGIAGLPFD
jgi:hypothetical protein